VETADLRETVALGSDCICDGKDSLCAAEVLRLSNGSPVVLQCDGANATHENLLHRVAEKAQTKLPTHLLLDTFERFNHAFKRVLAFVNEHERKLKSNQSPEERLLLKQVVGKPQNVFVTENSLLIVTSNSVVERWDLRDCC
jgi:hypothetical protein